MHLTYDNYVELGFDIIPEENFDRFSVMASLYVDRITMNRLYSEKPSYNNLLGIAEIADFFYREYQADLLLQEQLASNNGRLISGFKNDTYSESYAVDTRSESDKIADRNAKLREYHKYFQLSQLYRGFR
ncbi:MAG: hypothetical protein FWC41_01575 [Firmicutes bacterium]|nr:hypothetical protein [Bacillota bacterium]